MASPTASGSLLAGRYRVLERLGAGGMATVYLAEDERLGRRVAVKRLHAGSPEDTAKRFAREARLGASLNHENVVAVFDTVTDEGSVIIVMEYVDGESLADTLRRGRVEPGRAIEILRGAAAALEHAHQTGIVHRDVKPANILLSRDGAVKLADLGIATAVDGTRVTRTGSVMGTAAYMAPEQLDGHEAGRAADTYALATVAYEMLTGRPAYHGGSPVEVAHQVVSGPPPDLRERWPEAPPGTAEAIARGMAFEPGERPGSPGAFVDALAQALSRKPAAEADAGTGPTSALPPSRRFERVTRPPEPPRRPPTLSRARSSPAGGRRMAPLLALLALVVLAGALAAVLLGGGGDSGTNGLASSSSAAQKKARAERRRAKRNQQQTGTAPATTPAAAGGSGGAYAVPQPAGNDAAGGSRLQSQGHALIQQQQYDQAIPVLEQAVKSFPPGATDLAYAYALYDLGNALRLAGRPRDAIPVLEERLKIDNQRDVVQRELDAAKAAAG
ncbi:MAG: eukaryotic-like serine/threonine-protein kinase [Thermoleophilales bacterium]|nr:eukaryotic-like serine/threonine-protein kinase [Thermoleophilales bacterium]